jgi:hypothetical protein
MINAKGIIVIHCQKQYINAEFITVEVLQGTVLLI